MTTTLHAHVSTSSRDCDGGHGNDYVVGLNPDEVIESRAEVNDFHEITFRERVIANLMSVTGMGGTLTTTCEPGEWVSRVEWRETTEEGYRSGEARFCEDSHCDPNEGSNYDEYAQMMGF